MNDAAAIATDTKQEQEQARPARPASPASALQVCPYCGHRERAGAEECSECRGLFEPLSLIATQNAMGPWQIRDEDNPHRPGCSIETLRQLIRRGRVTRETVLRGPTTRQFWQKACETRGVAHLLGVCHACAALARQEHHYCKSCGQSFLVDPDRNWLGLDVARSTEPPGVQTPDARPFEDAPVPAAMPSAPVQVFDLFQPSQQASSPSPRAGRSRAPGKQSPARREAVAAATVALCAALLSVAIWAATATRTASPGVQGDATAAPEADPASTGAIPTPVVSQTPAIAPPSPPTPEELAHWRSVLERVKILSAAGDIESLESAAKALRELKKDAPAEAHPADLDDQIDAIESRIDDLTIRKFLRSPDGSL